MNTQAQPQRQVALDWLRGVLALAIMTYHLRNFSHGGSQQWDAGSLFGKIGIYGVSLFFLLSGLSMSIGYAGKLGDWRSLARFALRRAFRILPLLWLVLALVLLPRLLQGGHVDLWVLLLNLTASFGFVQPDAYLNTGAWTLGSEVVYYVLTPLLLGVYGRSRAAGNALLLATLALAAAYARFWLDPSSGLGPQWSVYVQPWNNLFLYAAGVALYFNLGQRSVRGGWPLLVLLVLGFAWLPAHGDPITLVTGWRRLLLPALCVGVVALCWRGGLRLPGWLDRGLEQLGLISYGIYLLHPIVFDWVQNWPLPPLALQLLVMVASVALAALVWRVLEQPMVALGRDWSRRLLA